MEKKDAWGLTDKIQKETKGRWFRLISSKYEYIGLNVMKTRKEKKEKERNKERKKHLFKTLYIDLSTKTVQIICNVIKWNEMKWIEIKVKSLLLTQDIIYHERNLFEIWKYAIWKINKKILTY